MIIWSSNRWTFDLGTKDSLKVLTLLILQRSTRSWSDLQTWHDLQQPSLPRYSYSVRVLTRVVCFINWMAFLCTHSQIDFSQNGYGIPIFLCVWSSRHLHLHLRSVSFTLISLFLFVFCDPQVFSPPAPFLFLSTAQEQSQEQGWALHMSNAEHGTRAILSNPVEEPSLLQLHNCCSG